MTYRLCMESLQISVYVNKNQLKFYFTWALHPFYFVFRKNLFLKDDEFFYLWKEMNLGVLIYTKNYFKFTNKIFTIYFFNQIIVYQHSIYDIYCIYALVYICIVCIAKFANNWRESEFASVLFVTFFNNYLILLSRGNWWYPK